MMKKFLLMTTMLCLGAFNAQAESYQLENRSLKPRIDLTARTGNDNRHIGTVEGWVPLAQDADSVLYTDLRFTRENSDDDEGNLGFGYRTLMPEWDAVVGATVWYDNRHTNRGTIVHQATLGLEYLTDKAEFRANVYMPIDAHTKRWITSNTGSATPYLAGTGIYVDTIGEIIEEPQPGFDIEGGIPFPPAEQYIDSLRMYAAYYSFYGNDTPDVHGPRIRLEADINPLLSIGARAQNDARGRQVFLEATLRFPYAAKLTKHRDGLRAHLDESPIRDIDVVTGSVVDTGRAKPVVNTDTGQVQRVLYVDNTASAGGDGSKEHPFNTLKTAESNLQDHDILYIARGDGTNANQDRGLVILKDDVKVIGSGVDMIWDADKYRASNNRASFTSGTVIAAATGNPVLSNIDPLDPLVSNSGTGILVEANDVYLSGFTVDTAVNAIMFNADGSAPGLEHINQVNVDHITINNTGQSGLGVIARNGGTIGDVHISDITTSHTGQISAANSAGSIYVRAGEGGSIGNVDIGYATLTNNNSNGIQIQSRVNATIGSINVHDITATNSVGVNLYVIAQNGGALGDTSIHDTVVTGGGDSGIQYLVQSTGQGSVFNAYNNTITGNSNIGIEASTSNTGTHVGTVNIYGNIIGHTGNIGISWLTDSGSALDTLNIHDNTVDTAASSGIQAVSKTASALGTVNINNNIATANAGRGVYVSAQSAGTITSVTTNGNTAYGNTGTNGRGIMLEATGAGSNITTITANNNNLHDNNARGIYITAAASGHLGTIGLDHNTLNTNAGQGAYAYAQGGGTLDSITLSSNTANGNTGTSGRGIMVETNASTISNVLINNNTTNNNAASGIVLLSGASGTLTNVGISGNTVNTNVSRGIYVIAQTSGTMGTVALTGNTANGNTSTSTGRGITIETNAATITTATLTNNITNSNEAGGIVFQSGASGVITTANLTGNTANTNTSRGIYILAQTSGKIGAANLTGNTANGNLGSAGRGILVESNGVGAIITAATLDRNTTNTNAQQGIYIYGNLGELDAAKLSRNTATGNASNGVFIDDDTTATFVADMGGGALGSTGGNRIYSNTGTELRVDLDGGQLKAKGNWWGVNTGLATGERTLDVSSTVDSTGFLTADPGP